MTGTGYNSARADRWEKNAAICTKIWKGEIE
jgi:hypothetical protein